MAYYEGQFGGGPFDGPVCTATMQKNPDGSWRLMWGVAGITDMGYYVGNPNESGRISLNDNLKGYEDISLPSDWSSKERLYQSVIFSGKSELGGCWLYLNIADKQNQTSPKDFYYKITPDETDDNYLVQWKWGDRLGTEIKLQAFYAPEALGGTPGILQDLLIGKTEGSFKVEKEIMISGKKFDVKDIKFQLNQGSNYLIYDIHIATCDIFLVPSTDSSGGKTVKWTSMGITNGALVTAVGEYSGKMLWSDTRLNGERGYTGDGEPTLFTFRGTSWDTKTICTKSVSSAAKFSPSTITGAVTKDPPPGSIIKLERVPSGVPSGDPGKPAGSALELEEIQNNNLNILQIPENLEVDSQ